jgi:hypothetical protein
MVGRGRKTPAKIPVRSYVGLSQSSTFPFRRNDFDHKLSEQIGRVCLVARSKRDRQLHYEVVVLQKRGFKALVLIWIHVDNTLGSRLEEIVGH